MVDRKFFHRQTVSINVIDRRRNLARHSTTKIDKGLLQGSEVAAGFLIRLPSENLDDEHDVGMIKLSRRFEASAIDRDGLAHGVRRKVRGEGKRQAVHGGEMRAKKTGSQEPNRHP